jgi:lysophospholipase L1-like esterase
MLYQRYVALGDSSTEGLNDPDGNGGFRGWSRRLAEHLAGVQGALLYANLGVRGCTTREIRDRQLEPALAMRPDLATVFSGTNDVLARRFDAGEVASDVEHIQRSLVAGGATVLTFTLPDLTPVMPLARWLAPRIRAMNEGVRAASRRTGAILLDFATYPVAADRRLWSDDRIHANAAGHARIAAALAQALRLPATDAAWGLPLPDAPSRSRRERWGEELRWAWRYLRPWIGASLTGASGREARPPAGPELKPVDPTSRSLTPRRS